MSLRRHLEICSPLGLKMGCSEQPFCALCQTEATPSSRSSRSTLPVLSEAKHIERDKERRVSFSLSQRPDKRSSVNSYNLRL